MQGAQAIGQQADLSRFSTPFRPLKTNEQSFHNRRRPEGAKPLQEGSMAACTTAYGLNGGRAMTSLCVAVGEALAEDASAGLLGMVWTKY